MSAAVTESLILDLLEWLCARDRTYEETMEAWRTSCPRLTVWEDAMDGALVRLDNSGELGYVRVTPAGMDLLKKNRSNRLSVAQSVASKAG